jgi:cytochrome c-type biogenesis protein CcmH/NrfF
LKPPFSWSTALLWVAPLLILLGAVTWIWRTVFSPVRATVGASSIEDLSTAEREALEKLMRDRD